MENKLDVLFIGGVFTPENQVEILKYSKAAVQNAANKLQWMFINGIEDNIGEKISIVNSVYIGTFPQYYKKAIIKGKTIFCDNKVYGYDVGFVNIPIMGSQTKFWNMKKHIYSWCQKESDGKKIVIGYGFFEEIVRALDYVKGLNRKVITCLIIVDLPEFMSQKNTKSKYHQYMQSRIYRNYRLSKKSIDCYVGITKQIQERLRISKPYLVIEGMVRQEELEYKKEDNLKFSNDFIFMYSGGLSVEYGTKEMLDAFMSLSRKNIKLRICGDGPLKSMVMAAAKKDCRIEYLGAISQDDCVNLQRRSSCLLNPRLNTEFTLYSFPSKMFEYFSSGVPVIARYLPGMPEEYETLFFKYDDNNSLAQVMERVYLMDRKELEMKANEARNYVMENKNYIVQTKKMLEFLRQF